MPNKDIMLPEGVDSWFSLLISLNNEHPESIRENSRKWSKVTHAYPYFDDKSGNETAVYDIRYIKLKAMDELLSICPNDLRVSLMEIVQLMYWGTPGNTTDNPRQGTEFIENLLKLTRI